MYQPAGATSSKLMLRACAWMTGTRLENASSIAPPEMAAIAALPLGTTPTSTLRP